VVAVSLFFGGLAGKAAVAALFSSVGVGPDATPTPDPYLAERHIQLRTPATIGPLTRSTDPTDVANAQSILDGISQGGPKFQQAVAALYDDPRHPTETTFVIAGAVDIPDPEAELDSGLLLHTNAKQIHTVDAGPLGGVAKCGTTTESGTEVLLCAWVDHGSVGAVGFAHRSPAEAEQLFGQIHQAVLIRD
jgi:hypothetical protein